jgi:hypothetical protein
MLFSVFTMAVAVFGIINFTIATPGIKDVALASRDGGYSQSCKDIVQQGWSISASCRHSTGRNFVSTTLDLNKCLANGAGGNMVCQPQ